LAPCCAAATHDLDATLEHLKEFAQFRRELIRLAREESPAKAREYVATSRPSQRAALNKQIVGWRSQCRPEVDSLASELTAYRAQARGLDFRRHLRWRWPVDGLAIAIVSRRHSPLARITAAIHQLAQGNMDVRGAGTRAS